MSIVVENLTKTYGLQKAVDNISFNVETGEVFPHARIAAEKYGVCIGTIRQALLTTWRGAGFHWEFIV